jgi:hypothetical protein
MALRLCELPDHPGQIAATKIGVFVTGGIFFLDFSRPLEPLWKPGLLIRWFHSPIGVLVPLVHQAEQSGGYVTGIHCSDPCYAEIHALWKKHYPSARSSPTHEASPEKIIADFAKQFPEDGQECRVDWPS